MSSSGNNSTSRRHPPPVACPQCVRAVETEWNKLNVAQQKLGLQQERLNLDQELLKAERKNLKRSSKLKKDTTTRSAAPAVAKLEILTSQLADARAQLQEQDEALTKQAANTTNSSSKGEYQEAEVASLKEQLGATQRSLATMLVDKESVQQERNSLQEQVETLESQAALELPLEKQNSVATASSITCTKCADQQIGLQKLQDELQTLGLTHANKEVRIGQERREWKLREDELEESHQAQLQSLQTHVQELQQEKEELQAETQQLREEVEQVALTVAIDLEEEDPTADDWKHEKRSLEAKLEEQSRQLDDLKLLVPSNKALLEQTTARNQSLQSKLGALQSEYEDQQELVEELQATKEALVKQQQIRKMTQSEALSAQTERLTHQRLERETEDTRTTKPNKNNDMAHSALDVVIPLDLEDGKPRERKHVVEWEWTSPTGLYGMYTGWLDLTGNPNGHGTLRIEDGSIFDGGWKDGLREAHGVYTSIDGDLYRGAWRNDQQHGRGVYVWPDGQMYTGDYVDGKRKGKGIETWPHGARYEGDYHHDRRDGQGTYWYPDGRCYSGEYKDDRPNGQGTQTASDGSVLYDGEWNLGEFING